MVKKPLTKVENYYIDNTVFCFYLLEHQALCHVTPAKRIKPSEELGEMFLSIAIELSKKSCFRKYTYLANMISLGYENGIKAITSFKIDKCENAFGYFSFIIERAFIREIKKENNKHSRKLVFIKSELERFNALKSVKLVNNRIAWYEDRIFDNNENVARNTERKSRKLTMSRP